jgi:hypothetical protein
MNCSRMLATKTRELKYREGGFENDLPVCSS